jgi:predicted O-methyltransferase YrrM
MPTTLDSEKVAGVLQRLFAAAEENDARVMAPMRAGNGGRPPNDTLVQETLGKAFIPVSPEGGRLLYILARAQNSQSIVEFGTSFGISTIHLAAAARDNKGKPVISTEKHPGKVQQARKHLMEAGLAEHADIREGDALETLAHLDQEIDFLFLDGWKDLYLSVLKLVEPRLRAGALVIADDLNIFPEALKPYLDYIRDPKNGYTSVEIPLGDGLELSYRSS